MVCMRRHIGVSACSAGNGMATYVRSTTEVVQHHTTEDEVGSTDSSPSLAMGSNESAGPEGGTRQADDAALVAQLIKGDTDALRRIMAAHWEALTAAAMITTNSADLAREAVQDAFVRLWESRATLDPTRSVFGYLTTITRRRALDLMRHEQMHERLAYALEFDAPYLATVSYNAGERAIESAELDARIVAAINALPPRCREIFLLNRQAKMSYVDIAAALKVSVPTIWNQMSQATQRISQAIARWRAGE